jgi:hypothetical protein
MVLATLILIIVIVLVVYLEHFEYWLWRGKVYQVYTAPLKGAK